MFAWMLFVWKCLHLLQQRSQRQDAHWSELMKISLMSSLTIAQWILISASASFVDTDDENQMSVLLETEGECYWSLASVNSESSTLRLRQKSTNDKWQGVPERWHLKPGDTELPCSLMLICLRLRWSFTHLWFYCIMCWLEKYRSTESCSPSNVDRHPYHELEIP